MPDIVMFKKLLLTGGGATAVDGISATALVGGELCWACVSDVEHLYQMNATSGATADGVNIIIPVVGTVGDKRWILQGDKVTTLNGLTLTAQTTGWTGAGGTTSKTLTVSDTITLALGAANLKQFMNAAGTDFEWANGFSLGKITYDTSTATGTQAITGVGFKPSAVVFLAIVDATDEFSLGFDNITSQRCARRYPGAVWSENNSQSIDLVQTAAINVAGEVQSFDADGFTISWVKTGAKTGGAGIYYMAFR